MDNLTQMVLDYQETEDSRLLVNIIKESEGLIYPVIKYYHVDYFPKLIQEEIIENCKSIVLIRAIQDFKDTKHAKFSTYYTWKLKSHIRYKQQFYLNRKKINTNLSLDRPVNGVDDATLGNVIGTSDNRMKQRVSKHMWNLFGV